MKRWIMLVLTGLTAFLPACDRAPRIDLPDASLSDALEVDAGTSLALALVTPSRGPFLGGNLVSLVGSGFDGATRVEIDGVELQPVFVTFLSSTRLRVRMPGREGPGAVDVRVRRGTQEAVLEDGYVYEALRVTPAVGPASGGLRVEVEVAGVTVATGDSVTFDGAACSDLEILAPGAVRCRIPAGSAGSAVVELRRGTAVLADALDAFEYVDAPLTFGGVDGGPIDGMLDVTALGASGPTADAVVVVARGSSVLRTGRTGADGMYRAEGADLTGPLDVHVGHVCYGPTSFVGIDARRIVAPLFLARTGGSCPSPPASRPTSPPAGIVEGRALWLDGSEFGAPQRSWLNVPPPRADEERVAYVTALATSDVLGVPTEDRITESDWDGRGFPFRLQSRSGTARVAVLAGLERVGSGEFVPYALGVSNPVAVPVGGTRSGVEVTVAIRMDRALDVRMIPPAGLAASGSGVLSITEAGYRYSPSGGLPSSDGSGSPVRIPRLPRAEDVLVAAVTEVSAWFLETSSTGITQVSRDFGPDATDLLLDDYLPVPALTLPSDGRLGPGDSVQVGLGDASPSLLVATITPQPWTLGAPGGPWRFFVRGDLRSIALPVTDAPELRLVEGDHRVEVSVEGRDVFDFDTFSVLDLVLDAPPRVSFDRILARAR
jgi:hypothetical protein